MECNVKMISLLQTWNMYNHKSRSTIYESDVALVCDVSRGIRSFEC